MTLANHEDDALLARLRAAVDPLTTTVPTAPTDHRAAAVLVLADPAEPGLPLLLMVRSQRVRHHRGQICFPGGGVEPSDRDPADTALREAAEEMGVDPGGVEVLGMLPPLVTAVSERWLTPVVAITQRPVDVVPDPFEVAEWFQVRLADLLVASHRTQDVSHEGIQRRIHYYEVGGRTIWGVTGAIVHELLGRLGRRD